MFGHDSQPSRVYQYGALEPTENLDVVHEQMRSAHRYRNALCGLELERRKRADSALAHLSPELVACETAIDGLKASLDLERTRIKAANATTRKRAVDPTTKERIATIRTALKNEQSRRKALRAALFASPRWETEHRSIDEWHDTERKRLRSECGLYWGTYLHVEHSCSSFRSGPPPRFARFDGGHLAVQIQGGMSVAEAFGTDSRFRISPVGREAWTGTHRTRRGPCRVDVSFRVGTMPDGRSPVMAVVPVVVDRPMPEDARIKWIHLIRRRIGTHDRWTVQIVLARRDSWSRPDASASGAVGIDIGWRLRHDGSLRVAYWVGSDGQEGELTLDRDWLGQMRRVDSIRSVRDKLFDRARSALAEWLSRVRVVPDPLREDALTLSKWKAQARMAAFVLRWRESRFAEDEVVIDAANPLLRELLAEHRGARFLGLSQPVGMHGLMEAWRRRDKHLYEFEANLRDRLLANRRDRYRVFAADLRRRYKTAYIEDLDLRTFHTTPEAEQPSVDGALKKHVRDAALSILVDAIRQSMTETVERSAPQTTMTCPDCGHVSASGRVELMVTCGGCGRTDDQDRIAARNLLSGSASVEVMSEKESL